MALTATTPLTPDPNSTTRPVDEDFLFTVEVVDRRATAPTTRSLQLFLSKDNDLVFADGDDDGKVVTQKVDVGKDPVAVEFDTHISGQATKLSSFRVSLREEGGAVLVFCLVRVRK